MVPLLGNRRTLPEVVRQFKWSLAGPDAGAGHSARHLDIVPKANMKTVHAPIDWLLEGEPWVAYRTRLDLLGQSEQDAQVMAARKSMLADARIRNLLAELSDWPGTVIASHKSASQPFHKLTFISDLGLQGRRSRHKSHRCAHLEAPIRRRPFPTPDEYPNPLWGNRPG